MKKLCFLLIPLLAGVTSCGAPSISNQEDVDNLKTLLNKQDLSEFYSKGLGTMFTQEYDVLEVSNDEDEKTSNYFNYSGGGFLDMSYELSKEDYEALVDDQGEINVFDALSKGEGGYRITQTADATSFLREGRNYANIENLNLLQQMTLKTTAEDVLVYNVLDISDKETFDYASRQNFNGSIDKKLLFGSVSTRSFRDIFTQVNLFDAPSNVVAIDNLYFSICRELKNKTDKEISDFIAANQISMEEVENTIELSFVYANEGANEKEENEIFPGAIKGKLIYDKQTGAFNTFEYEMKHVAEFYDEESGSVKTANSIFACAGKCSHGPLGDMWTADDPKIYDDVVEFLEDVTDQVVPPSIIQ